MQVVQMIDVAPVTHCQTKLYFFISDVCVLQQVSDTLKKFAVKVTTASVSERKEILGELKQCISGKGEEIDAHVVSIICLFSALTLFIFCLGLSN